MRIRYVGSDDARDLAIAGGFLHCPRNQWVDVEKEAAATGIAVDHAVVVAREVVKQDGWQLESAQKAAKTRKQVAQAPAVPEPAPQDETPPAGEEA